MSDSTALALVLGVFGTLVFTTFTAQLAGMFWGIERLPKSLRSLAQTSVRGNRLVRASTLVMLLVLGEGIILAALVLRRSEFDLVGQAALTLELACALAWLVWLLLLYRRAT